MNSWEKILGTVAKLRDKNSGCPWDLEQTHQTLRPYILEEAMEAIESIENLPIILQKNDPKIQNFKEELGDLLFQSLLQAQLASESGLFNANDVLDTLNEKLIRRHPHVFGGEKFNTAEEVKDNWQKQKIREGKKEISSALPALMRAEKIISRVSKLGFQWDDLIGPMDKLEEEWAELKQEIKSNPNAKMNENLEKEIGDLFFCVANISFKLGINPEIALQRMLRRFEKRFEFVEKQVENSGRNWEDFSLAELDNFWIQAKKNE